MNARHVSILGLPEAIHSTVAGLSDTFNVLGLINHMDAALPDEPPFVAEVLDVSDDESPSRCAFEVQRHIRDVDNTDIVIVPAIAVDPVQWEPGGHAEVLHWLRKMHDQGVLICSTCSGALVLAQTGLLDAAEATTHWAYEETFRRHFPHIPLRLEKLLVQTGKRDEIIMSGAAGSWHDLALYLIAHTAGVAAAQFVAKFMLLEWHVDGQRAYSIFTPQRDHGDAIVAQAQEWLDRNLSACNPVEAMMEISGIPARTFNRRFAQATGLTPIRYVQQLRIEHAKRYLERSTRPIEQIAWQVGYEDVAFFRRVFKRLTGICPGVYRRKLQLPLYAQRRANEISGGAAHR